MRKNQNKSNYQNKKDIEERVQISKEYCDCEEDIDEAIERSKRKLGSSNAPYGYSKIDEQITTKIYKIPEEDLPMITDIIKVNMVMMIKINIIIIIFITLNIKRIRQPLVNILIQIIIIILNMVIKMQILN